VVAKRYLMPCRGSASNGSGGPARPGHQPANMLTLLRLVLVNVFLLALFAGNGHETASPYVAL